MTHKPWRTTMGTVGKVGCCCLLVLYVIIRFLSSTSAQLVPETEPDTNECVNEAYQYWLKVLLNRFIKYADLTAAMSVSRRLFDVFLMHRMSVGSFREYCKEHRYARSHFNRCNNSTYKKMVVSNFGLADYICSTRIGDYGRALSCLYGAADWASVTCRSNCTEFEDESRAYLERDIITNSSAADVMQLMAADCSYLQCMHTCRQPRIAAECGEESARLITDALRIVFTTSMDTYEPPEMRQMIKGGFHSPYPRECRHLASIGEQSPKDTEDDDQSGSKSTRHINGMGDRVEKSRRIRMLVAVSTDILTNASLMCRFGSRVREFFASYCPTEGADGGGGEMVMDGDFMSLAIDVT